MRSRLFYSVAGVLVTLSFWAQTQAQAQSQTLGQAHASALSKRIVSLNPLSASQSGLEAPRPMTISALPALDIAPPVEPVAETILISQVEQDRNARLLASYIQGFKADPDVFVQATIDLYEQTGGALIWYRSQGWVSGAEDAFRILEQAQYDGLPAEKYLAKIPQNPARLRTPSDIVQADFALTLGLLRFSLDLKFGLGHEISPGTLGQSFKQAYSTQQIDVWIDGFRPETPLYLRLHKALLLGELNSEQAEKAALTLHRERQPLLVHPDRHIVVDVGLQELTVYENRREVMAMPVVVGKPERRTPLLSDQIVNLKFSPDWSVTPLIAREDILPILQDDPSLIGLMGIRVLDASGAEIPAASVDWQAVDRYAIPYRFRMEPGIDNLLGGVRFSLTNDQAIFLHDSPERDRYGAGVRTFSSGCVRVGDSAGLASWIMGRQMNWERKDVIAAMVRGKTRIKVLPDPIAVDFVYSTVGMKDDGALFFKPDIYGEDAKLARRIGLSVNDVPPPIPKPRL